MIQNKGEFFNSPFFLLSLKSIKEKHKTTKPMKQEEEPITGLPENAFRELKPGEVYNPLMSPDKKYSEVNAWSVTWGILMAILFSAAAAYLGLKVGQVFEAAIPIAIIAVGVSGAAKRKNALGENVIIQSIGASSGVIVAGAIFTLPALYILQGKYSINSLVYWVTYVHNVVYSFYRSMIYCYINSTQRCAGSIVIDIIPTNGADKRKFFPFAPYFPVTNVIKRYFYPYFPAIIGIKGYSFPYFPYLSGIMKIKTALYSLFSRLDWHKTVVFPCLGEIYEGIRSLSWEIPVT